MMIESELAMWNTHDWMHGTELPICRKCARGPIGLGFWGDDDWKATHPDYLSPCSGTMDKAIKDEQLIVARLTAKGEKSN